MKIFNRCSGSVVYTDCLQAYENIIPFRQHVQGKTGTCTVEGLNGVIRHQLARMRRKTKCYSKSMEMLNLSVKMLILKRNNALSIFS